MQMDEAQRLRQAWRAKGFPSCSHPHLDREYALSSHPGDKVYTTCGEDFNPAELRKMGR